MASCGRRVERAGLKLVFVFPYAWVDTTAAWLESRRRRMLISAAGPCSDLGLGGGISLIALLAGGLARDIGFQLALGAYLGAFYNLNPLLDRDGYHLLVDALEQPGLRRRARAHLSARLAGRAADSAPRAVRWYGSLGLGWSLLAALAAAAFSLRYRPALEPAIGHPAAWMILALVWCVLLAPTVGVVAVPLRARRGRPPRR
jgi:hypothetical protein